MTRKEKMELKRLVKEDVYSVVQAVLLNYKNADDFVAFHKEKDKLIDKTAGKIVERFLVGLQQQSDFPPKPNETEKFAKGL